MSDKIEYKAECSFKGLITEFEKYSKENSTPVKIKIVVPLIQRDYAQGRDDKHSNDVRERFLDDILNALKDNKKLELDFIYGKLEKISDSVYSHKFIPLDGQQRLTTLYLLHWYLDELPSGAKDCLSYETRASAREFCDYLAKNSLDDIKKLGDKKLSTLIKSDLNFMSVWQDDPSVKAMLNMLDSIKNMGFDEFKAKDLELIKFKFLNLDKFKLTDELYVKMNARGKPLNEFELIKAELERIFLENGFDDSYEIFVNNIETTWVDSFWEYQKDGLVDNALVRYIDLISELIYYKDNFKNINKYEFKGALEQIYSNEQNANLLIYALNKFENFKIDENELNLFGDYKSPDSFLKVGTDLNNFSKALLFINLISNFKAGFNKKIVLRQARNILLSKRNLRNGAMKYKRDIEADDVGGLLWAILEGGDEFLEKLSDNQMAKHEKKKAELIKKDESFKNIIYKLEEHSQIKGDLRQILVDDVKKLGEYCRVIYEYFKQDEKQKDNGLLSRAMLCIQAILYEKGVYEARNARFCMWRGWGNGYSKYFFGASGFWEILLTHKRDYVKITDFLDELIKTTPEALIAEFKAKKQKSLTYEYYFVNYDEFLDDMSWLKDKDKGEFAKEYRNCIIWGRNAENDNERWYNAERLALKQARVSINPYLHCAIKKALEQGLLNESDVEYGIYGGVGESFIEIKGVIDELYCLQDGWRIKTQNSSVEMVLSKEKLGKKGGFYILKHEDNSDTIKNMQKLLKKLLNAK